MLINRFEVGEREFRVDRIDVVQGIDRPRHMGNVVILEAAHDVGDRIRLPDVGEELIAEPLTFRCTGHQTGDVDELHGRRNHLLRFYDPREHVEPRIRNRHDTHVRLDGAKRIILRRNLGRGKGVEQRRLADVG